MNYIKGKGILVGEYNEKEVLSGKDKQDTKIKMKETGFSYTNTELVKKNGKIVSVKVYVCSVEDFKIWKKRVDSAKFLLYNVIKDIL